MTGNVFTFCRNKIKRLKTLHFIILSAIGSPSALEVPKIELKTIEQYRFRGFANTYEDENSFAAVKYKSSNRPFLDRAPIRGPLAIRLAFEHHKQQRCRRKNLGNTKRVMKMQ